MMWSSDWMAECELPNYSVSMLAAWDQVVGGVMREALANQMVAKPVSWRKRSIWHWSDRHWVVMRAPKVYRKLVMELVLSKVGRLWWGGGYRGGWGDLER